MTFPCPPFSPLCLILSLHVASYHSLAFSCSANRQSNLHSVSSGSVNVMECAVVEGHTELNNIYGFTSPTYPTTVSSPCDIEMFSPAVSNAIFATINAEPEDELSQLFGSITSTVGASDYRAPSADAHLVDTINFSIPSATSECSGLISDSYENLNTPSIMNEHCSPIMATQLYDQDHQSENSWMTEQISVPCQVSDCSPVANVGQLTLDVGKMQSLYPLENHLCSGNLAAVVSEAQIDDGNHMPSYNHWQSCFEQKPSCSVPSTVGSPTLCRPGDEGTVAVQEYCFVKQSDTGSPNETSCLDSSIGYSSVHSSGIRLKKRFKSITNVLYACRVPEQ